MSVPRCVRITGGPMPQDFRIVDAETGKAIPDVVSFTVTSHAGSNKLCMATLTVFAELDVEVNATVKPEPSDLAVVSVVGDLPCECPRELCAGSVSLGRQDIEGEKHGRCDECGAYIIARVLEEE